MADHSILAELAPHAKIAAAAFAGGIVRLFLRPASTIMQGILLISSCVTCGYYGQPVASYMMGMPDKFDTAISALVGLMGVSFAQAMLKAMDRLDLRGVFLRLLGVKQDGE